MRSTATFKLIFSYFPKTILRTGTKHPHFLNLNALNLFRSPQHNVYGNNRKYVKQTSTSSHFFILFYSCVFLSLFSSFYHKTFKKCIFIHCLYLLITYLSQNWLSLFKIMFIVKFLNLIFYFFKSFSTAVWDWVSENISLKFSVPKNSVMAILQIRCSKMHLLQNT